MMDDRISPHDDDRPQALHPIDRSFLISLDRPFSILNSPFSILPLRPLSSVLRPSLEF
jgi:hypothetical protein